MIMDEKDIILVDRLVAAGESHCVEFMKNNRNPSKIGKLCSALSNAARMEKYMRAYSGERSDVEAVMVRMLNAERAECTERYGG